MENQDVSVQQIREKLKDIKKSIATVILGQEKVIDQMLVTLLCNGHALLEGVPGTAKTLAVRAIAKTLSCRAKRIQFTPDLMPSDIIGTRVFNLSTNEFQLHKGPIFTDLLLGDEINRAPAKTQSALLEGMSENHATIDGERHMLSDVFTVFATQNPIEYEGTYPLPEAQQDRFLMKIKVDYPERDAELEILNAFDRGHAPQDIVEEKLEPVLSQKELQLVMKSLHKVKMEESIKGYVLAIVRGTRDHDSVLVGAGPRGAIYLMNAAKGQAVISGRSYVTPDDVVEMVEPVLAHRLTLTAEAEIEGTDKTEVLRSIVDSLEVPR